MEPKEILERIKLMMNYDSKKTLTENREFLNEAVNTTNLKIYEKIDEACGGIGTDINILTQAFDLIARNWKNSSWLSSLDKYMKQAPIDGGMGDTYTSLQEVLNGELGVDNCDKAKEFASILSRIEGIKASCECLALGYDMKANSFKITYTPTQKPAENKKTEQASTFGKNITDYPLCVQQMAKTSKLNPTSTKSGQWSVTIGGIYYYPFADGAVDGRKYDATKKEMGYYHCAGTVISPGRSTGQAETPKGAGGGGSPGSAKGGSNQPYPWKDAPSIADVQSGKATINSGMSGDSVTEIQNLLNASGAKLKADSKFGGRTKSALKAFQKKSGTTNQKGVVDADTYNKLKSGNKESVEIDNTSINMNSSSGDNKKTDTGYDVIDSGAGPSSNSITM